MIQRGRHSRRKDSQEIGEQSPRVHMQTRQSRSLCLISAGKSPRSLLGASVSKPEKAGGVRQRTRAAPGTATAPTAHRCSQTSSHLRTDSQPTRFCLFAACALAASANYASGSSGYTAASVQMMTLRRRTVPAPQQETGRRPSPTACAPHHNTL